MKEPAGLLGPGNDLGVGYKEYMLLQKSTELSVYDLCTLAHMNYTSNANFKSESNIR